MNESSYDQIKNESKEVSEVGFWVHNLKTPPVANSEEYRETRLTELVKYQIDSMNWDYVVQVDELIAPVRDAMTDALLAFYRGSGREFFDEHYADLMSGHDIPLPTEQYDIDIANTGHSDLPNPHEIEPNGMYLDSCVNWCMPCGCPESMVLNDTHWPHCKSFKYLV